MSVVADWLGTLRSTFRIGRVTLDSGALTAARAVALPDASGTMSLLKWTRAGSAPASPLVGDRWLHSTTGVEYTWVDDGTSSQWVEL